MARLNFLQGLTCVLIKFVQPASHRALLASLDTDDDVEFVTRLAAVVQWQSDAAADLNHFAGVCDRIEDILTELMVRVG
jgi:hypothetical protein